MLQALNHVHMNGFAHRDMKLGNIYLDSDFNVKIADFPYSAPVEGRNGSGFLHTFCGSFGYMASEISLNNLKKKTWLIYPRWASLYSLYILAETHL